MRVVFFLCLLNEKVPFLFPVRVEVDADELHFVTTCYRIPDKNSSYLRDDPAMVERIDIERPLVDYLAESGSLDPSDARNLLHRLVSQVAALHSSGRVHLDIRLETISLDDQLRPHLGRPEPFVVLGNLSTHPAINPPELQQVEEIKLPTEISAAQDILEKAQILLDPRRIDIYQLGCLACELLTGQAVSKYLRSPGVKALVPTEWRKLVDHSLGYDPAARLASCKQLRAALDALEIHGDSRDTTDTPRFGTSVDVLQDTPPLGSRLSGSSEDGEHQMELPFQQLGHFRIVGRLGRGGMGDVYRGYDEPLSRDVAVKVLSDQLAEKQEFVRRFREEATAAAKLSHPNIVQIHFIGEDQGKNFFAMQLVEGETLAERLQRDDRLNVDEALFILEQLLTGLKAAHDQGLIHRDIKPGNVLLDADGKHVLLADFGLAATFDSNNDLTATGIIMGTIDYMSPEQARGKQVDVRADIYSVGVMLYHTLAGRLPFESETPTGMLFQHAYEQPFPLQDLCPKISPSLAAVVAKLMAKDPDDRYQNCAEILVDFQAVREGHEVSATNTTSRRSLSQQFVTAPTFDDVPTVAFTRGPALGSAWEQVRDYCASIIRRHTPKMIQELQGTTQQVDGVVAEYGRRRNRLAALHQEAQQLSFNLRSDAENCRNAAAEAEHRIDQLPDSVEILQARHAQKELEQSAAELLASVHEQDIHTQEIGQRLQVAEATTAKLEAQREAMMRRLRVATGERLSPESQQTIRRRWTLAATSVGLLLVAGILLPSIFLGNNSPADGPLVESRSVDYRDAENVEAAYSVLAADPTDAWANLVTGKQLCYVRNKWELGLLKLAMGSDVELRKLAILEQRDPEEAAGQLQLADGWWDASTREDGAVRKLLWQRAFQWYAAVAQSTDISKEARQRALARLKKSQGIGPWRIVIFDIRADGDLSTVQIHGSRRTVPLELMPMETDNYLATWKEGQLSIKNKNQGTAYPMRISVAVDLADDGDFSIERYKSDGKVFLVSVYYKQAIIIQGDNLTGRSDADQPVVLHP